MGIFRQLLRSCGGGLVVLATNGGLLRSRKVRSYRLMHSREFVILIEILKSGLVTVIDTALPCARDGSRGAP